MVVVSNACCDNSEDMLKLLAILLSQGVVISAFTLQMGELMYEMYDVLLSYHSRIGQSVFFVSNNILLSNSLHAHIIIICSPIK